MTQTIVTMREVAERAAVSLSTASLAVNDKPGVDQQTRRRVMQAAEALGYQRRGVGRPRKTPEVREVLCLAERAPQGSDRSRSPFRKRFIEGVRSRLVESGAHLTLGYGLGDEEADDVLDHLIESSDLSGVILLGVDEQYGVLNRLWREGLPFVVYNPAPRLHDCSYVGLSNLDGGRQAIEFLIERGRQRIGLLPAPMDYHFAWDRLHGARLAFERNGREPVCEVRLNPREPHVDEAELERACAKVLEAEPDSVFITKDNFALHCINVWERWGVRIPEDLWVVGFDGLPLRTESGKQTTSIAYDMRAVGWQTSDLLMQRLEGRTPFAQQGVLMPTHLMERDTTG